MTNTFHWNALYTRGKEERKVCRQLEKRGIVHYCPEHLDQVMDQGVEKTISKPIFTSLVFVRAGFTDGAALLKLPGVINFKYWQDAPVQIADAEIEALRDFMERHPEVKAAKTSLVPIDQEAGTVTPKFNVAENIYSLQLATIGYCLTAPAEPVTVKLIRKNPPRYRAAGGLAHLLGFKNAGG